VVGARAGLGTLLGPEGTGLVLEPSGSDLVGLALLVVGSLRSVEPLSLVGVGAEGRGGTARSLRTAQWTRASLIFCGQVYKSIRWMPWH
jgi:hypothetical protein